MGVPRDCCRGRHFLLKKIEVIEQQLHTLQNQTAERMLRFYNLREFDDERAAKEVDSSTVVAFLFHHLDNSPALIADCLNPTHLKPLINSNRTSSTDPDRARKNRIGLIRMSRTTGVVCSR